MDDSTTADANKRDVTTSTDQRPREGEDACLAEPAEHSLCPSSGNERKGRRFDDPNDPSSPVNWSVSVSIAIEIYLETTPYVSLTKLTSSSNMGILLSAPFAPNILKKFGNNSKLEAVLFVSIWELGEVISPLLMGPISELVGRKLVYNCANICFIVVSCGAGLSRNAGMLIAFRFLCGLAIASTTLNSCIVGDMFRQDQRGRAISWLGMMPFIGPVLGPVVGGYVSQVIGWRWTFWITAIVMGLLEAVFLFTFCECYAPHILNPRQRRPWQQHKQQQQDVRPLDPNTSNLTKVILEQHFLGRALYRPFKLLFSSPVIILVSLNWILTSAYLHLLFNTMNFVYEEVYHLAPGPVGLAYIGLGLGMIVTVLICRQTLDLYLKSRKHVRGYYRSEDRLPPVIIGSVLLCIGIIWFGWAVKNRTHWIIPILASSLLGASFVATSIGIQSYIVDSFGIHAASALAGAIAVRNTAATVSPLVGPDLWASLGYGLGGTTLALIGLAFIPIPAPLLKFRERLRQKDGENKTYCC